MGFSNTQKFRQAGRRGGLPSGKMWKNEGYLVGGWTNPPEKYYSNLPKSSQSRGENFKNNWVATTKLWGFRAPRVAMKKPADPRGSRNPPIAPGRWEFGSPQCWTCFTQQNSEGGGEAGFPAKFGDFNLENIGETHHGQIHFPAGCGRIGFNGRIPPHITCANLWSQKSLPDAPWTGNYLHFPGVHVAIFHRNHIGFSIVW